MHRAATAAVAIFALASTTGISAPGPDGIEATEARASVKVVKRVPLTVRGTHFRSSERIRISAAGRNWRLRATPRGSFTATLRGIDRCDSVRMLVVGDEGSRVIVKILPSPLCAPQRSP
jgi:hypothetical protein